MLLIGPTHTWTCNVFDICVESLTCLSLLQSLRTQHRLTAEVAYPSIDTRSATIGLADAGIVNAKVDFGRRVHSARALAASAAPPAAAEDQWSCGSGCVKSCSAIVEYSSGGMGVEDGMKCPPGSKDGCWRQDVRMGAGDKMDCPPGEGGA